MWTKPLCVIAIFMVSSASGVVAERAIDTEPVLRLRLQDVASTASVNVKLRPRFDAGVTVRSKPVPMPRVRLQRAGRVGSFAYVATPHPNLVVAVGSTVDRSEIGREIDRAIIGMARAKPLYDHSQDRAPFIGVGVQARVAKTGWAMDASIGANFINRAETPRVFGSLNMDQTAALETEGRANVRLRYRF